MEKFSPIISLNKSIQLNWNLHNLYLIIQTQEKDLSRSRHLDCHGSETGETNFVNDGLVPVRLLLPVTPVFDKAQSSFQTQHF